MVAICRVEDRALVIGSTQDLATVDTHRVSEENVDLVRRTSGGGAVLLEPAGQVWVDLWLPRSDELWEDDVVRSATWVGEVWARALSNLGATPPSVHTGRATDAEWSRLVCFAGLGPGEVTVAGRKIVGISQRRVRAGARISTLAHLVWEPSSLMSLLAAVGQRGGRGQRVGTELARAAVGLLDSLGAPRCPIEGRWESPPARDEKERWRSRAAILQEDVEQAVIGALP
jgi:lipoate-protein ligase A